MTRLWLPILIGIAVMLAACTQDGPDGPDGQAGPTSAAVPTVTPAAPPLTREEVLGVVVSGGADIIRGTLSMEEVVLSSSAIARVSYLGHQA